MHADWLIPDWPAPAGVRAVCTTRAGGLSGGPWESMNMGDHVGDAVAHVQANRSTLAQHLQARPVFMKQVHGTRVLTLTPELPDGLEADASVSVRAGLACTVMVADCLPVLFAHRAGAVAAAHAGWRGLAGDGAGVGVIESTWRAMAASVGLAPEPAAASDAVVWLGPCIGPDAFEVGPDVVTAFEAVSPEALAMFTPSGHGKYLADLPGLARQRLRALGITAVYGNDGGKDWCTVSNPSRFFSHRRDTANGVGGVAFNTTGRMAASVWRV